MEFVQLRMAFPPPGESLATVPTLSQRHADLIHAAAALQLALQRPPTALTDKQKRQLPSALETSISADLDRLKPQPGRWHAVFPSIRFGIGDDPYADATIRRAASAAGVSVEALGLPKQTHIIIDTRAEAVILDKTGEQPTVCYRRG